MIAYPGDSNYSRLSVMIHFYTNAEMLFKVSKKVFLPKPKVSSAVIMLTPKNGLDVDEFLLNVIRALFQHKRKKVRNALMDSFHEIGELDKYERRDLISKLDQELLNQRVFNMEPKNIRKLSKEIERTIKDKDNP